jgi:hypothetical protein
MEDNFIPGRANRERHIRRERIVDDVTGYEFGAVRIDEVSQTMDGVLETHSDTVKQALGCPHPYQFGEPVVRCDSCSEKAGHPIYVCSACAVTCPVTGAARCLKDSVLGQDGRRYSVEGLKQAKKLGLFDSVQPTPPCVPSRNHFSQFLSRLRRVMKWW